MLPVGRDKRVLIAELAAQDTEYVVGLWSRTVRDEDQTLEISPTFPTGGGNGAKGP